MAVSLTCTRCHVDIAPERRLGTPDEPYCLKCWLITYYDLEPKFVKLLEKECQTMLKRGVPFEEVNRLMMNTIRQQVQNIISSTTYHEPLPDVSNMRLEAIRQNEAKAKP